MSSESTTPQPLIDFKICVKGLEPLTIRAIAVQQITSGCVVFHNEKGEAVCIVPVAELIASTRLDAIVAETKAKLECGPKAGK